jgi:hypothetical protein
VTAYAGEGEEYKAVFEVCDAAAAGTSNDTTAMMDEMSRLGAMWEEAWHATLADLQVRDRRQGLAKRMAHHALVSMGQTTSGFITIFFQSKNMLL